MKQAAMNTEDAALVMWRVRGRKDEDGLEAFATRLSVMGMVMDLKERGLIIADDAALMEAWDNAERTKDTIIKMVREDDAAAKEGATPNG